VSSLKRLGIDEIALRKGQGDYIVVLVDLDRRVPLGFALSGNYKGLVNKLLPNATVVADRFHVMKIVNQDLDAARNRSVKPMTRR
jgi:transposase